MSTLEAIVYRRGHLEILDQLQLPHKTVYIAIHTVDDAWQAIRNMQVRGAPAIAIVAACSLGVELTTRQFATASELADFVRTSLQHLRTSRPTAVNLFEASARIDAIVDGWDVDGEAVAPAIEQLHTFIETMLAKDVEDNQAIGKYGAEAMLKHASRTHNGDKLRVLTHCNTGSLATAGYGTALGVIRALQAQNKIDHAFCTETRPYNQGARLTAYELVYEKIPSTLVADSMVSLLMRDKGLSGVVVGADRVAANGDTANKIGTYQIAIAAKYHGVPFFVAAPLTSVDLDINSGSDIVIEERPGNELTHVAGVHVAADGIGTWNPAFDVTPANLITGIITEKGVAYRAEGSDNFDMQGFVADNQ